MIVFALKRTGLQARRFAQDITGGPQTWPVAPFSRLPVSAESRTNLWTDAEVAERRLQLGKVQNLRIAVGKLNGVIIEPDQTFSFWKQIGRASTWRGYAVGRELREGCLIPAIGGGLCQLSNALYELALQTGCEIIERHGHSVAVPGSAAAVGRDATVAWNYIDLRFKPPNPLQIEAFLTRAELVVRFRTQPSVGPVPHGEKPTGLRIIQTVGSCVTCGEHECLRHAPERAWSGERKIAFLLDAVSPEFQSFVLESKGDLFIPIDGSRWRMPRYAWSKGSQSTTTAYRAALTRAWRARKMSKEPPPVVRADQLACDALVAFELARKLATEHEHIIVSQTLLPGLWLSGQLGGRTFDVLMTRLPMAEIHDRLDQAFATMPHQRQLGDFRADRQILEAESEALAAADRIITPHTGIASLFPGRAVLIDWISRSEKVDRRPVPLVVFPGPTAARKGAFAVREAVQTLGLPLIVLGRNLEEPGFWDGVTLEFAEDWPTRAGVVIQPSISEDRPTALLRAKAAGIPIVATDMCGLRQGEYTAVHFGDVKALTEAIRQAINGGV